MAYQIHHSVWARGGREARRDYTNVDKNVVTLLTSLINQKQDFCDASECVRNYNNFLSL